MTGKTYEYSTNNADASYAWSKDTPESVRRLQNPAEIIGNNVTAYYIYHYRLYEIKTSSGINATNRLSDTSVITDCTEEESGGFQASSYHYGQYLVNLLSSKQTLSDTYLDERTVITILNYLIRHLPSFATSRVIINAETLEFIYSAPVICNLALLNAGLILPDFVIEPIYDKIYTCLCNITEEQNVKYMLFISDMYISSSTLSDANSLYQDYAYYLALISDQKEAYPDVFAFVKSKQEFCRNILFREYDTPEKMIQNSKMMIDYFSYEAYQDELNVMSEKQFSSPDMTDSQWLELTKSVMNHFKNDPNKLTKKDKINLTYIYDAAHTCFAYFDHEEHAQKIHPPQAEQLNTLEYFQKALSESHLKTNLNDASCRELYQAAEYCKVNQVPFSTLQEALMENVEKNEDFLEYYQCMYLKKNTCVSYHNDIPAMLFAEQLITFHDFRQAYGEKKYKKKWKEMDKRFLQHYYQKVNVLYLRTYLKLALSRSIYIWRDNMRFADLENLRMEDLHKPPKRKERK